MSPSDTTRHHALSLSPGIEADFDFLAQRQSKLKGKFSPSCTLAFRSVIVVLLLILLILLVVDLRKRDANGYYEIPIDQALCLYPVGGGETHVVLPLPQILSTACISLYKEYFKEGGQYWKETELAIGLGEVLLENEGNYTQMVIIDIDETSLSNIPLNLAKDFDTTGEERKAFIESGTAPAIPATLEFYKKLRTKGFSVTFLTGRRNDVRNATMHDLDRVGYGVPCEKNPPEDGEMCYHKLITRRMTDSRDATIYKGHERAKLKDDGFDIIGSIGDQWSDLSGTVRAPVIIKMPNPIYYLP